MISRWIPAFTVAVALAMGASPAGAVRHAGDLAPTFSKVDLDGVTRTLEDYRGKVVVLFLLGYA